MVTFPTIIAVLTFYWFEMGEWGGGNRGVRSPTKAEGDIGHSPLPAQQQTADRRSWRHRAATEAGIFVTAKRRVNAVQYVLHVISAYRNSSVRHH